MNFDGEHHNDEPKKNPSDRVEQERFDPWEDQFQRDFRSTDREFDF